MQSVRFFVPAFALLGSWSAFAGQPVPAAAVETKATAQTWEIAAGVATGELNLDWDFKGTFGYETNPLQDELSDDFVTPSIDLRRVLRETDRLAVRLGIGYSYAEADWKTGEHDAGEIGEEPDEFYAIDIASASLTLHRVAAYIDVAWKAGQLELGLRAGPTLNIMDANFRGSHENFQHVVEGETGRYRGGEVVAEDVSDIVVGASAEAFVRYNVPGTAVFLEVSGGYNWTDAMQVGSSTVGAEMDAASWRAGVSIGFKF